MSLDIALSGDTIIGSRISVIEEQRFLDLIGLFRNADIGFTHLESPIHDFEEPEIYPAAEAGGGWAVSPTFAGEELDWAGFDMVSHASNHALDYAYGGLYSTWDVLDRVEIAYAGTGRNLADARSPTYVDTAQGRVALISMTPSFTRWSRAGEARRDMQGRPGVNPLRYHQIVDSETMETIKELAADFGWWIVPVTENKWELTPPGIHNTVHTFIVDDESDDTTVVDERDERGHLRSIEEANAQADIVMVHAHVHEWNGLEGERIPPDFLPPFAKNCLDAGADMFISQGSHNLRGIEVYDGKPIFYDLGDFLLFKGLTYRVPADYYERYEHLLDIHPQEATPSQAAEARWNASYNVAVHPPDGYFSDPIVGCIVPVCEFQGRELTRIELHTAVPLDHPGPDVDLNHPDIQESKVNQGTPIKATGETARELLEYVEDLSEPFGTTIEIDGDTGVLGV